MQLIKDRMDELERQGEDVNIFQSFFLTVTRELLNTLFELEKAHD